MRTLLTVHTQLSHVKMQSVLVSTLHSALEESVIGADKLVWNSTLSICIWFVALLPAGPPVSTLCSKNLLAEGACISTVLQTGFFYNEKSS